MNYDRVATYIRPPSIAAIFEVLAARNRKAATPGALGDLRSGYEELAVPAKEARVKSGELERRLSELVNRSYGLTEEEISLMWNTAPPRMPEFRGW